MEAAKLTSSHPNAAQDIEWKRHELEEAWASLREQVCCLLLCFTVKTRKLLFSVGIFLLFSFYQAAARKGKLRDSYDYFNFLNEFR